MKRRAILLVNRASSSVPADLITSLLSDLEGNLSRLGDYSFDCTSIRDETSDDARARLKKECLRASKQGCDLLLLYYFGHAVVLDDELHLFFKDSTTDLPATMVKFRDAADIIKGSGHGKVVFVLDCCYAGAGADQIVVQHQGWKFYLMAAATGTAQTIASEKPSVGIFTDKMLSSFGGDGINSQVTFKRFFQLADQATRGAAPEQEPYARDGGLADEIFFESHLGQANITVVPGFNVKVPRKSSYRKLYLLSNYVAHGSFATVEALYKYAKKENDVTFQVPIKTKKGTEIVFMSPGTFYRYTDILVNLGVMDDNVQLLAVGSELIGSKGAMFNEVLWGLVQAYWQRFHFDVAEVLEAIVHRVRLGQEPTARAIRWYLFQKNSTKITPEMMRITLDLAGYMNAIPYCSEKTFYPLPSSPAAKQSLSLAAVADEFGN